MVGAFWFLPILKIGPIPTRATPWISARAEPGTERFGSASGQDVAHVAWVPAATACCRNTTRVERFSEGVILPAVAAAIYGASASRFSRAPEDARQ